MIVDQVGANESVIVMTHEPNWLLDWYWGSSTGQNVTHLIEEHLKGRCRLRLAGDLHNYMRHSSIPGSHSLVEHLLVNGQGGAFLHPTHIFEGFKEFHGGHYENQATYPSMQDSRRVRHHTCTPLILLNIAHCLLFLLNKTSSLGFTYLARFDKGVSELYEIVLLRDFKKYFVHKVDGS
jgi:hypothetical protein